MWPGRIMNKEVSLLESRIRTAPAGGAVCFPFFPLLNRSFIQLPYTDTLIRGLSYEAQDAAMASP